MTDKSGSDRSIGATPFARMPRTISSHELLQGERLVIVRHDRESYRLQLTASGKLILTK